MNKKTFTKFTDLGRVLGREEMKKIMAGSGSGGGGGNCWGSWGTNNYCSGYPGTNWILCSNGQGYCVTFEGQSPDWFCCTLQ